MSHMILDKHERVINIEVYETLIKALKEALLALTALNEATEGYNAMPSQLEQRIDEALRLAGEV